MRSRASSRTQGGPKKLKTLSFVPVRASISIRNKLLHPHLHPNPPTPSPPPHNSWSHRWPTRPRPDSLLFLIYNIISVQGEVRSAHSRGGRVSARDEGAFHFSIYGFTLSALTRYYTFLVHKTRILFPFEVMILYVAVPEMRSLKSHAPSHLRTHARPHRTHFGPYLHSARQMFHSHLALVYRKVRVRFPGLEAGADRRTSQ